MLQQKQHPKPRNFSIGPAIDPPLLQYRLAPDYVPPGEQASEIFGADAPEELTKTYLSEYRKHLAKGMNDRDARLRAIRHTEHAGWLKGRDGWKQRAPDMRGKINVTEGVEQPDGTFFVPGVPVFYANAVKGADNSYAKDDIDQVLDNTVDAMKHGFKPVLLEGHPDDTQKARGYQLPPQGYPINFRKNKDGVVECDLKKVKPGYMKRLREETLPSLSVGYAMDRHGLGKVIAHVAGLGGTAPALRYLKPTEYFSVSGNYLCFSADTENFPKGRTSMLSKKHEDNFASMYSAFEACQAAKKAKEVGQPDADARIKEADKMYKACAKAHFDAMSDMGDTAGGGDMAGMGAVGTAAPMDTATAPMPPVDSGAEDTTGAYDAEENMDNQGIIPAQMPMGSATPAFSTIDDIKNYFSDTSAEANPALAFNALCDVVKQRDQVIDQLRANNNAFMLKQRADKNRLRCQNFQSEVVELRRSGRILPDDKTLTEQRDACFEAKDPDRALDLVIRGYKAQAGRQTPATFNGGRDVFDARDVHPTNGNGHGGKVKLVTASDMAGVKPRITKEDLDFAALSELSPDEEAKN